MKTTVGIKFTTADITDIQSPVAKLFFMLLKENIQNQLILMTLYQVSVFTIGKKMPKPPKDCSTYGDESIKSSFNTTVV